MSALFFVTKNSEINIVESPAIHLKSHFIPDRNFLIARSNSVSSFLSRMQLLSLRPRSIIYFVEDEYALCASRSCITKDRARGVGADGEVWLPNTKELGRITGG